MGITELDAVRSILAANPLGKRLPLWELRDFFDRMPIGLGMPSQPIDIFRIYAAGVHGLRITPESALPGKALLYFHGGAFVAGSPASHRHLAAKIAVESGLSTFLIDYRLAPEAPYPAAVDDALAAYRHVLDEGHQAGDVVLAGDSAGGGLCVSLMLKLKELGLPLPAGCALLSPWVDLSCSATSFDTNAQHDPLITRQGMMQAASTFLAGRIEPTDPRASPVRADLTGLPPLLIQVGNQEALLDDSILLASRALEAKVDATLEVTDGVVHVWHLFWSLLPEARASIDGLARFLLRSLASDARPEPPVSLPEHAGGFVRRL
jgi:monoterpene epsilon-lactone hydrolase